MAVKPNEDRYTHATLIRRVSNKDRMDPSKTRKEIYDIGLSFSVTPQRLICITELVPGDNPRHSANDTMMPLSS